MFYKLPSTGQTTVNSIVRGFEILHLGGKSLHGTAVSHQMIEIKS